MAEPSLPDVVAAGESARRPPGHLIVGIGASAGGLAAYQAFFAAMPDNTDMAFVLVQHLDPNYESALAEIIGECTAMPVAKARDGTVAAPNTVSVIPPNAILKIENGILRVAKPETATARRSSVDTFLVSLAQDQGENAVGIILAGYGSDGTIGIAAIKECGGLTLSEAAFDHYAKKGMPQSAVAGGFVDNILPVEGMPAALLEYRDYKANVGGRLKGEAKGSNLASHLVTICSILHSRLGRDFGQYKTSTMLRRIHRRMQVLRIEEPEEYAAQLRILPDEPELLFREILIGVTRFFRDAATFELLAGTIVPALLANNESDAPIRVWVAGCATGEEAYSLAILFKEACLRAECMRTVMVFATDVDDRAIKFARAGLFTDVIEADISVERLEHHFIKEGKRYRVAKHIRDMCVFSTHDLVKDPPFSRLDMVSCRNLLIYFEVGLQQRVLTTFHYGLKSRGILWLGPSETIASSTKLFKSIDKRSRIYERLDVAVQVPKLLPSRTVRQSGKSPPPAPSAEVDVQVAKILARFAPAYIVVDSESEVQRFSGPVAKFLEPVSGGASLNLFRLLHAELRASARTLVRKANESGSGVQEQISFHVDGRPETINLIVEPMTEPSGGRYGLLLAFQEVVQPTRRASDSSDRDGGIEGDDADHELVAAREKLQTVTEELETANEELQSSNEEFQSVNEELHSTVEELETSKEELQSINEELQTVNAELNNRADSLVRSNSDLANLFDSTSIATLFLDNELCIRRFTPAISDIFNVREGDEGRPITDFASRLADGALALDSKLVLRDLKSVEREVDSDDGKSTYLLRIKPYRALNNVIDGVSITLVDISERKNLDKARAHLAAIVESSEDAIISHDLDGLITSWNTGAQKIYGYMAAEIIGEPMSALLAPEQIDEWPASLARLRNGEPITNFDISRTTKSGHTIHLSLMISPIRDENGKIVGASAVARDIAERKAAEERALLLMAELDHRVKNILAVVSAVVSQTLRSGGLPETVSAEIEGRVMAIARAHNLLTQHGGTQGSLRDLIATEVYPYEHVNNITLSGADIVLTSNASLTLALAVHELATNAAKYGALSVAGGQLSVSWRILDEHTPRQLEIEWRETGGPPVSPPSRRGFGTRLIEVGLIRGLGATVDRTFAETGVCCLILLPLTTEVGGVRATDVAKEVAV
jgi:two-component system, chemotaxis family, CheB/CheR fusion protein